MTKKYMFHLSLLAAVSMTSVAAHAQEAPADAPADNGDIIVTAQKIEQRSTDVPITISAVSGRRIAELGVSDLDELSAYIPGLNIQEQSANNPGVVIRGITSDSGSAQQGARVSLYYNGIDISRSRGSYQAIYDLERVEVIKGPQATLFGTASAVGAISLTSARPRDGFSAQLTGGYGNFNQTLLGGYINAGSDVFATRIAFEWRTRDGFVENLSPFQDEELYAQDQLGVRVSMRWTPGDAITVDLIGTYDRQRNGGTPFISGTFPTSDGAANPFGRANLGGSPVSAAVLGAPQLGLERDVYDINLTVAAEIAPGLTFTTVNGYRDFDSLEIFDADGTAAWYLEFAELAQGWQASHEGRFAYSDPQWRATFGWNVFREDSIQNVPFSSNEPVFFACATSTPVTRAQCVAPGGIVPAQAGPAVAYSSVFENGGRNDSYSVFADATWIPAEAIEITAGARVLIEERESRYFARVPRPRLNPTAFSLIPGQIDTAGQTFRARRSYAAVLPRFNILYRLNEDSNIFATVSQGRRSPVVQLNAARVGGIPRANQQFVPEENVWNYEVGVKGRVGPVSGAIGVYYQAYDGFQVSVIQPNGTALTQSAGTASNLGVEAELNIRAASWLQLFGNIGYIDGGIDEDNSFAPQFAGARFRLQPEWQAAGGFTLDVPIGSSARFFVTPTVTHRSRIFFEVPNNPLISQGPITLVNARAGIAFADDRFELAAYIRNAFNEDYLLDAGNTGGAFGIPTFIPGEPRFYGIQLTARY